MTVDGEHVILDEAMRGFRLLYCCQLDKRLAIALLCICPVILSRAEKILKSNEMGDFGPEHAQNGTKAKKQILLNAFDMSTVGHLSPGQWKVKYTWIQRNSEKVLTYSEPSR